MARHFGGILGFLAFSTVIARGWWWGADLESAVWPAVASLFLWGAVGYVAGKAAEQTIGESLRRQLLEQLQQQRGERASHD